MRENYTVWKIGTDGTYMRLIKDYSDRGDAVTRAESEADDEWRSGVKYVVTRGTGRKTDFSDVPAERVGMDGIKFSTASVAEFEA